MMQKMISVLFLGVKAPLELAHLGQSISPSVGWLVGRSVGRSVGWSVGWLVSWSADWLVGTAKPCTIKEEPTLAETHQTAPNRITSILFELLPELSHFHNKLDMALHLKLEKNAFFKLFCGVQA